MKIKEKKTNKIKNKSAISLILLVITILVLAILAGVIISRVSDTSIISSAGETAKKAERLQIDEMKVVMTANGVLGRNPKTKIIGSTTLTWNPEKEITEATVDNVVVPDGFYYEEGTKDTGLVIEDREGNQFVWIPVEYTASGVLDDNGLDTGFTAVFRTGEPEDVDNTGVYKMTVAITDSAIGDYCPRFSAFYEEEKNEYYSMCKSVQEYHGFYIARFEAGDGEATEARTTVTKAHKVVSKKGAIVYNYVPWGTSMQNVEPSAGTYRIDNVDTEVTEVIAGAVYLSRNMYATSDSVVSTLCHGVQWDAVLNFVSDTEHNITDAKNWGNYYNSTGLAKVDSGIIQTTCGKNEAWQAKNIYDLAGNVTEWTMECFWPWNRWIRGGRLDRWSDWTSPAARQYNESIVAREGLGFRVALYLK